MYKTVQGEATNTGRVAVFVRLRGCNLWNGRNDKRDRPACAAWCDVVPLEEQVPGEAGRTSFARTDGPNGGTMTPTGLRRRIAELWDAPGRPFVVLTGGEPTMQLMDPEVFTALADCDVAVETNGTMAVQLPASWFVTVSPKGAYEVARLFGDELKLVYPQLEPEAQPEVWEDLARVGVAQFDRYYLQPMEPLPGLTHDAVWYENTERTLEHVAAHPFWRVSVQTHKLLNLP